MAPRGGRVGVFWLLLLCRTLPDPVQAQVRHPVPVLWMMPVSSGGQNLTASVAPAVRLALQDLKTQPAPLGNYEIQLQLLDSQCDPAESLKALFDAMWAGPKYLLLFGGVCPPVTALIARSLPALNLLQVSFAASSPSLSNRKWYGNLFSTVPSDRALNQAAVKLLQRHHWTRVGLLSEGGARLAEMKKDLLRQLLKADVQLVSAESLSEDVCSSLERLKQRDVRIIIGQFEEDSLSELFFCAHRLNMFGPRYQWLLLDGGAAGWRPGRLQAAGCSTHRLQAAADGAIRLQMRRISSSHTPGVSGRTPQDYQDSYLSQLSQDGSEVSPLHAFAYDAVWVLGRAVSQVMEAARNREKFSSRRNVSVSEEEVQRTLLEAVRQTHFEGVTGPVSFRNGERMTSIELIQFQGSRGVLVGDFSTSTQQLRLMNHLLKFKGPGPARDRALVVVRPLRVGLLLYSLLSSAAAVTVFIALSLLFFTVIHRKHWLLRLSGGCQDDLLLLLSVLLSSSSVLVSGLDEASLSPQTLELLCSVRLWTLSVGHSLGVSVLLCRAWRLKSLCSSKQQQGGVQTSHCVLLCVLLLDLFVLITWQTLDPLRRVVLQHGLQRDEDVLLDVSSERCSSSNTQLWLTALCGPKAALMVLGCLLAWSIRTVQVDPPAVSSTHLSVCVFAVCVFSVCGLTGSLLTAHNPPVHFCVSAVLVLCCNVFVLSFMFGPKVWFVCLTSGDEQQPAELQSEAAEEEEERRRRRLNQQLKSLTAQLDVDIETLSLQLCEEAAESELTAGGQNNGRCVTHTAQMCSQRKPSTPDNINSPEHVRRRLSVQLPILHHAYLPAVGGVSSSCSSLSGSRDAFLHC